MLAAEILEASAADAEEVSALAVETYVATFGSEFEPDELAYYLERTISVPCWTEYLARDRVLLARISGRSVGYVQFGPFEDGMEIRRLYVLNAFHGQGIGTHLLRRALEAPKVAGARAAYIEVWEQNHEARRLYERFGFRHEGKMTPFILKSGAIDGYDLVLVRRSGAAG